MAAVATRVSVQAGPRDRASWLRLAADVDADGFEALYVADHPGTSPAPFVALAAAAAVTRRIRLGTCVANGGMWDPVALASEVRTLDVLSDGRAVLGVGAGHTPQEWRARGAAFPSPAARVDRMIELVETTTALLSGEVVSYEGEHVTLIEAALAAPPPVQEHVPLLVGGNGTRLLRFAASNADIVGVTGLGRTLPDGHRHEVDWSRSGLRRLVDIARSAAAGAGGAPELEALVQHVEVTDDAGSAARRLLPHVPGATVDELLDAPFVWIGTSTEISQKLRRHEAELGIQRYVIRAPAIPQVRRIIGASP